MAAPIDAGTFELLETLAWDPRDGFLLIDEHLARLRRSAIAFRFAVDADEVRHRLDDAIAAAATPQRVRLTVDREGRARVTTSDLRRLGRPLRVTLATDPISSDNVFLYHKTTNRGLYERAMIQGFDEVLLWNEQGEVTEATTGNVVAVRHGRRITPPVKCGLLPGTYREVLLAEESIHEEVVRVDELPALDGLWVINSVQGWRAASLEAAVTAR